MIYLIEGGSKSGKSVYAQKISKKLSEEGHLWYLATMEPKDEEDYARIRRHLSERAGWGFQTAEWGRNILGHSEEIDCKGTYLVDSVTTLLSNEMFSEMASTSVDREASSRIIAGFTELSEKAANVIYVSDDIYCDGTVFEDWTDAFRENLALIDRSIASYADCVVEFVCGNPVYYKGAEIL